MPLDPVDLTLSLMRIDSTSGRESEVMQLAQTTLESRGWAVQRIPVSEGRDNIFASAVDAPLVTLSTHLDTVPPYIAPRVDGGRVWGRGACDAKGIAAAMLAAADRLASEGEERTDLLFVVGEEKGSDGARAANGLRATSRWLINGEPTESRLATGAKGSLRVTVRTRGRAAHSAYPHLGVSAIE
ncbi:MAG TPA: M20/M25/M40 family metallo-hydrolase, partial [Gemmatimonadaceae bacterium]